MTATVERPTAPAPDLEPSSEAPDQPNSAGSSARPSSVAPPLTPARYLLRGVFLTVAVVAACLLLQLLLVGRLQQSAAQVQKFDDFREALASGTAPIGPADFNDEIYPLGTPVARLEIPAIGLDQIVSEGTTAEVLFDGPGHRRDTPLPGQVGVSFLFGRRTVAGGVFGSIASLDPGAEVTVTTQQGEFEFSVVAVRRAGDPLPPLASATASRVTLTTADGSWWAPDGVVRVDADLVGQSVGGPARLVTGDGLTAAERPLAVDTTELWLLMFFLQVLLALSIGLVWAWHRWGRPHAWITFLPPLLYVGIETAGQAARLLPNLM